MLPVLLKDKIREKLVKDAVKDLRRWMFPKVNNENIFTDITYAYFFEKILEKQIGRNEQIDLVITGIRYELFELHHSNKQVKIKRK